jgi:hypothetical protein
MFCRKFKTDQGSIEKTHVSQDKDLMGWYAAAHHRSAGGTELCRRSGVKTGEAQREGG